MRSRSLAFFLALACLGMFLFWHSFDARYQSSAGNAEATMLFPRILLGFWIVLSGGAVVESWFASARPGERWAFGRVATFVVAVGAYLLAIPAVGFLFASVGCAVLSLGVFGFRKPTSLLLFGLLLPGFIWALFTFVVPTGLPTSPWFGRV